MTDWWASDPVAPAGGAFWANDPEAKAPVGGGAQNTILNGMTFGLADEVAGAGSAVGRFLRNLTSDTGVSPGQAYDQRLASQRAQLKDFARENPVAAPALEIGGSLLTAAPARGVSAVAEPVANGVGQYGRNVAAGATMSAASGFGTGEGGLGERAKSAVGSALLGGTVSAAIPPVANLVSKMAGRAFQSVGLRNADNAASDQLLRAFERDGITPEQALGRLSEWQQQGAKPEMLFDLGGDNVRGLARAAAGTPSEAKTIAAEAIAARQQGQSQRISQDVAEFLNPSADYHGTIDALTRSRQAAAAPAYERAYAAPPIAPDVAAPGGQLGDLMGRPSMRQAAQRALRIAAEEGRDPNSLGIGFNESGDAVFQRVPSWQTLDYVKRGLDDVLEQFRSPTTGRLVLDESGRAINGTKNAFLQLLDGVNPDYAAARASFSGPSQSLDALRLGRELFKQDADISTRRIADMAPGDREFFRAGVVRGIRDILDNTPDGADAVKRLFGKPAMREKLQAAFDTPEQFQSFRDAVARESNMYRNGQAVTPRSGSQTDPRAAERADMETDPATGFLGTVAGQLVNGSSLYSGVMQAGREVFRRGQGMNSDTADALARTLYNPDPMANARTLADLARRSHVSEAELGRRMALARSLAMGTGMGASAAMNTGR